MSEMSTDDVEGVISKVLEKYFSKLVAAAATQATSISGSGRSESELDALRAALKEAQDRQTNTNEQVKSLHKKELETLKSTIALERRESAEVQK
jgi:hypothetical protein